MRARRRACSTAGRRIVDAAPRGALPQIARGLAEVPASRGVQMSEAAELVLDRLGRVRVGGGGRHGHVTSVSRIV